MTPAYLANEPDPPELAAALREAHADVEAAWQVYWTGEGDTHPVEANRMTPVRRANQRRGEVFARLFAALRSRES